MDKITAISNSKIQYVKRLKDKSFRDETGFFVVEGENIIKDFSDDITPSMIFVLEDKLDDFTYILDKYPQDIVFLVDSKVMKSISDTVSPCGILAVVGYRHPSENYHGNCVVLDKISDPGNMGTIIRTCVACGIGRIYCVDCVDFLSGKVVRSSMGALFHIEMVNTTYDKLAKLLDNTMIMALDMGGKNIFELKMKSEKPFALVVGSEAHGVSAEIKNMASEIVSLPMYGKIESLNAAVSLSIGLYIMINMK